MWNRYTCGPILASCVLIVHNLCNQSSHMTHQQIVSSKKKHVLFHLFGILRAYYLQGNLSSNIDYL